jgi:hypothetical protein
MFFVLPFLFAQKLKASFLMAPEQIIIGLGANLIVKLD